MPVLHDDLTGSELHVPKTHAASHTDGTDDLQDATAAQKGLMTADQAGKLDGVEALADVTDATNVAAAGALMAANNLSDLSAAATARTNLGLGGAAVLEVGATTGTVCAGDDSRLSDDRAPTAHASEHTDGTDDIQDATTGQKGLMTVAQATKLDGIETAADVTDATNVAASGATMSGAAAAQTQLTLTDLSAGPADPADGSAVIWMSDGTGAGDAGDIMVKITSGAVTKTATLVDYSAI